MRLGDCKLAALAAVILAASPAVAGMDFGNLGPIAPGPAAIDGDANDLTPSVASDDNGVWVAAWRSEDPALGADPNKQPLVFARSTNDGVTWSMPSLVDPSGGAFNDFSSALATDTSGTWVIAWDRISSVLVSVSTDNGVTWGPPTTIIAPDGTADSAVALETDRAGVWVLAWSSEDSLGGTIGSDLDILVSRSADNGGTWSAPAPLNTDAAVDLVDDGAVELATDGAGTWGAAWGSPLGTVFSRSTDNGATWEAPVSLGSAASLFPDIATDGAGRWAVVSSTAFSSANDINYSHSTDDGATWSPESLLHPYLGEVPNNPSDVQPVISVLDNGLLATVWESADNLRGARSKGVRSTVSYSRDGGASWSSPSSLTTRPRKDFEGGESRNAIAATSDGTSVVAWSSHDPVGDTLGSDRDILFARSVRDCPVTAREDCLHSTSARGSRLKIKDSFGGRDLLSWRLGNLEETLDADLGDPVTSDSLAVCLYEKVGGAAGLIGEWDARSGGSCAGGRPCWSQQTGQITLKDGKLDRGSIKKLIVRAGAEGSGQLSLRITGAALAPPLLPLDVSAPVRIQLINLGTGACWEGVHEQARTNDAAQFSSRSE